MSDYKGHSDDELFILLESLSLELSCLMGTEEGCWVEKMYWEVMSEIRDRGLDVDKEEEKEKGLMDSLKEDKTEKKDNFGFGRDYEDDGFGDLPF
jgi:hypothetical protein|tara:strand:+ start:300 stop:584 length:285 start_codon:yes stop_codon:yes gene_type:complete